MNSIKTLGDDKGMTLLEVMVALVIVSVVMLGTAKTIFVVINNNSIQKDINTAMLLLQDKNERLKIVDFANIAASTENNLMVDASGNIVTDTTNGKYTRTVTLTTVDATTPITESAKVTITLSWGTSDSITSSTIYSF